MCRIAFFAVQSKFQVRKEPKSKKEPPLVCERDPTLSIISFTFRYRKYRKRGGRKQTFHVEQKKASYA